MHTYTAAQRPPPWQGSLDPPPLDNSPGPRLVSVADPEPAAWWTTDKPHADECSSLAPSLTPRPIAALLCLRGCPCPASHFRKLRLQSRHQRLLLHVPTATSPAGKPALTATLRVANNAISATRAEISIRRHRTCMGNLWPRSQCSMWQTQCRSRHSLSLTCLYRQ